MFQLIVNILITFSIYILIAFSFSTIYYLTKFFHIAQAAIISLGAYFSFLFLQEFQLSIWLSIPLAISLSVLIGLLCEVLVYKQMRAKDAPLFAYLVVSIGIYTVLQNSISLYFGDDTKVLNTIPVTVGHQILGAFITTIQIITVIVSLLLFITVVTFIKYTSIGKSMRAVASNPSLSTVYGIKSNKVILWAITIGSALGAIAGILSAMDTNMTPTFGFNLLLYGVVAMIIGGIGSYRGLIAGSLLVATAQHLSGYYLDTKWMDATTYIILIVFLLWKPLGFSGKRLKKVEI
jgi:branched-chain amino acid transport system permease protein